jgi:hypothetical protein
MLRLKGVVCHFDEGKLSVFKRDSPAALHFAQNDIPYAILMKESLNN